MGTAPPRYPAVGCGFSHPAGIGLSERFGRLLDEPLIPSSLRAPLV